MRITRTGPWKQAVRIALGMVLAAILLAWALSTVLGNPTGYELSLGSATGGGAEISGGGYTVASSIASLNSAPLAGNTYTVIGGVMPGKYLWSLYLPILKR
jgi:hypothetical protein